MVAVVVVVLPTFEIEALTVVAETVKVVRVTGFGRGEGRGSRGEAAGCRWLRLVLSMVN